MVKHNFESKKGRNGRRYAVFVIAPRTGKIEQAIRDKKRATYDWV